MVHSFSIPYEAKRAWVWIFRMMINFEKSPNEHVRLFMHQNFFVLLLLSEPLGPPSGPVGPMGPIRSYPDPTKAPIGPKMDPNGSIGAYRAL